MKKSFKTGFSFGLTSGIITTLGLMMGLYSSTNSRMAVIGGILTIAIADALSDALGIHISEESEKKSDKHVWEATFATFASKFLFALTFIVPVLLFCLTNAIIISVIWGLALLTILSAYIAQEQKKDQLYVVLEHITIAVIVLVATYFVGTWISVFFV